MIQGKLKLISKAWHRFLYPVTPYWTASIYGFGKWIRRYGFYPPILPLCIYTDHGPGDTGLSPHKHELDSSAPAQFYHSCAAVRRWKKVSNKPCYPLLSPFVYARRSLGIEKSKHTEGTIFFVAHSTPSIDENKPIQAYHEELTKLPATYKPITICLHIHDVRKGLDGVYRDLGYEVVCAGDSLDERFTERFYNILQNYKYALSNLFGSYGFYAIEMGIPFGLYGTGPDYFNKKDPNVEAGSYSSYERTAYYKKIQDLFGQLPSNHISTEQREFVNYHLGLESGIGRLAMMKVLYGSLFMWLKQKLITLSKSLISSE